MGIRNIFEREREKPALLIRDAWIDMIEYSPTDTANYDGLNVQLKLSQEIDLNPGLLLPVANLGNALGVQTAVGVPVSPQVVNRLFDPHMGTVWAPRAVGVRVDEQGGVSFQFNLFLSYEMIMIPWWDWIVLWDYLDNVTDLENQY